MKGTMPNNSTPSSGDALAERVMRRIPVEVVVFALLLAVAAAVLFDTGTALFVLAGGILAALNFVWLNQTLSRVLLREKKRALKTSSLFFGLRLILILAIFFIIIFFFSRKIIAFAAGFSSIVVVLLFEAIAVMARLKTWKN
jgi:hypothetical protein